MPSSWAVTSQHFGLQKDSECLEMAYPDTYNKQRHGSSFWVSHVHFYSFSYTTHTVYGTNHKQANTASFLFFSCSLFFPIYAIVFIASLNAIIFPSILDAKNA